MGSEWERGWFCFVMLAPDAGVLSGRDLVMGFYLCFLSLVCLFAMLLCFIHLIIVRYAFSFAFSLFVVFALIFSSALLPDKYHFQMRSFSTSDPFCV